MVRQQLLTKSHATKRVFDLSVRFEALRILATGALQGADALGGRLTLLVVCRTSTDRIWLGQSNMRFSASFPTAAWTQTTAHIPLTANYSGAVSLRFPSVDSHARLIDPLSIPNSFE